VNSNSLERVAEEVRNKATLDAIASFRALTPVAIGAFQVLAEAHKESVVLRQEAGPQDTFNMVKQDLTWYIRERADGHSQAFLLGTLTNREWRLDNLDSDLDTLVTQYPMLPTALLRRWQTGGYTNGAGSESQIVWQITNTNGEWHSGAHTNFRQSDEVVRWTSYALVDGDVAWIYQIRHPGYGASADVCKVDAKEVDPKFHDLILSVEKETLADLKEQGLIGRGFGWRFDRLKKEKLKLRGVLWRSPAELNPGPMEGVLR